MVFLNHLVERLWRYFKDAEKEYSEYNFEKANVDKLFNEFDNCVKECNDLISSEKPLVKPAYDQCIKASHIFNLLMLEVLFLFLKDKLIS